MKAVALDGRSIGGGCVYTFFEISSKNMVRAARGPFSKIRTQKNLLEITVDFKSKIGDNGCILSKENKMEKLNANNERPNALHYQVFQSNDRECMFQGAKHWDVSKSDKYRQVCSVNFFGGLQLEGGDWYLDNKEEVFKVLNGYYYDEETNHDDVYDCHVVGFGVRRGVRKDGSKWECRDMHSLSVGDILVDYNDLENYGKAYIVDSFGFKEIEFNAPVDLDKLPINDQRVRSVIASEVQF